MPQRLGFLTLAGELDMAAKDDLRRALARLETADVAILDFTGVTYCDSTAIGALIGLRERMLQAGRKGEVRIVGAGSTARRIFEICGIDQVFSLHQNLTDAGALSIPGESDLEFVGSFDAGTLVPDA